MEELSPWQKDPLAITIKIYQADLGSPRRISFQTENKYTYKPHGFASHLFSDLIQQILQLL